jgi:hypothetical protein
MADRVVRGLVHHAPLVAAEVIGSRLVLEVGTVGKEEQRLRLVGGVERATRGEQSLEAAAAGESQEARREHRHRPVVAGLHLARIAVGRRGERVGVVAGPLGLLVRARTAPRLQRGRQSAVTRSRVHWAPCWSATRWRWYSSVRLRVRVSKGDAGRPPSRQRRTSRLGNIAGPGAPCQSRGTPGRFVVVVAARCGLSAARWYRPWCLRSRPSGRRWPRRAAARRERPGR